MSYLYICLYVYFHIIYSFSVSMKSCWVFISVYRLVYNGGMMWIISTTLLFVPDLYLLWNYYHSYAIFLSLDPLFWFSLSLQFIIIIKIFSLTILIIIIILYMSLLFLLLMILDLYLILLFLHFLLLLYWFYSLMLKSDFYTILFIIIKIPFCLLMITFYDYDFNIIISFSIIIFY